MPAQGTFISKMLYVKMIGIIMYMYSATTFFFLSSVQVSLRRLLRIRIWKGRVMGLGFGVRVFRVYCRVWLGLFWFLVVFRFSLMGLDWPQFFEILTQRGWLFIGILNIGTSFENDCWSRQTAATLCKSCPGVWIGFRVQKWFWFGLGIGLL